MKFYANDIVNTHPRRHRPSFIDDLQFGSFLDALPDGAALLEPDGRIKLVNHKLELLLNLGRAELVGADLNKHAKTIGPLIQKISTALHQLKRVDISGTLNSQRNVSATLSILRTVDGGAYGALLTMREASRSLRSANADNFSFEGPSPTAKRSSFIASKASDNIIKHARDALKRGANVLLLGETGTGKSEITRQLGFSSEAGAEPFVHVRCGLLADSEFDAEMFGIEAGSPSDTTGRGKLGYIEAADGGILFLDQITDLSLSAQARLVGFLETETYSRLGSAQRRQARVKIISATNHNLMERVANGSFRKDLYYRIAVMPFEIPPLRSQPDLLSALIDQQLASLNSGRVPRLQLSTKLLDKLLSYDFPGNIRELTNILSRISATADAVAGDDHFDLPVVPSRNESLSTAASLPAPRGDGNPADTKQFRELVQDFENWVLEKSIAEYGSKRSAAKALGIDIATLVRKTKRKT